MISTDRTLADIEKAVELRKQLEEAKTEADRAKTRAENLEGELARLLKDGSFGVGRNVTERFVRLTDGGVARVRFNRLHPTDGGSVEIERIKIEGAA